MLLGHDDIDPNKPDQDGETPLLWAVLKEYAGVVKTLLGRDDLDPNKPDKDGQTPLWWATHNGYGGW